MKPFHELSYEKHRESLADDSVDDSVIKSWFARDTVDYWRHYRMFSPIIPLLIGRSTWLTIGDGRWGLDSIRLKSIAPAIDILPTDLSPYLLIKASDRNLIDKYSVENAENLSFENEEFDYSFCKEAYHHFPRPFLALYEMLRVSKKGVILIEPRDQFPRPVIRHIIEKTRTLVHKLLHKNQPHPDCNNFEPTGNYVYTISERELEKMAIAVQLPLIAFHYFDDHYIKGVEFEKVHENGPLFRKIKLRLLMAKLKAKLGLRKMGFMIAVIFKKTPKDTLMKKLIAKGFRFVRIPKNPYISLFIWRCVTKHSDTCSQLECGEGLYPWLGI